MSELQYEPMDHSEKIEWLIETAGWFVEPVRAVVDPVHPFPTYSYTVGLESLLGHPEIAIFGLAAGAARGILEMTVDQLRAGVVLPVDQPFVGLLDGALRAMLVTVDKAVYSNLFPTPELVYGDQPWRIVQLVWPHSNGALPWEDGWPHELRLVQPIHAST